MNCDPSAVTLILGFSLGGLTLAGVIQLLKNWTKLTGVLAQALSMAVCFIAAAAYVFFTKGDWGCLIVFGPQLYIATQAIYQVAKKS